MERRPAPVSNEHLLQRVRGEFLEMPGLRLTRAQAQRLWGLDNLTCEEVLRGLIERQFLVCSTDGRYMRSVEGRDAAPHPRMLKADLPPDLPAAVAVAGIPRKARVRLSHR